MNLEGSYEGRVWKVDLTSQKVEKWKVDPETVKSFIGGSGVGWKLAADLIKPGIDPFSPENVLIFNPSVLAGTLSPGTPKVILITKFATIATEDNKHFIGAASGGGRYFTLGLKQAGCDHLVITGKSEKPIYLRIT
ncbi:MAG: aldehyde ferredoxin oxidoreductase, partial [Thaumarchaeota archaeon]|nr:aldehyde ferredoxin oxidoreductase [Nitrososphaerota archaeon]